MDNKTEKQKTEDRKRTLSRIWIFYNSNINSLLVFLNQLGSVAAKLDDETKSILDERTATLRAISDQYKILIEERDAPDREEFQLRRRALESEMSTLLPKFTEVNLGHGKLLRKGVLVLAFSYYEILLSQLIAAYYHNFPAALPEDHSLKLSEMRELDSLQEAEKFLIDKETETVMRKSSLEQLKYIRTRLHLELAPIESLLDDITEIGQRRNIIVHNDSEVNRIYIRSVAEKFLADGKIQEGKKVQIDQEYVVKSIELLHIVGVYLIQESWRKWKKDQIEGANDSLHNLLYDLLVDRQYARVVEISAFGLKMAGLSDSKLKYLAINTAIALRELNREPEMNTLLQSIDWSACPLHFEVALHVLRKERVELLSKLDRAINGGEITPVNVKNWPLFSQLQNDPDFQKWMENKTQRPS